MKPKDIMIGGRLYTARPMRPSEAVHGAVLRARDGRNVYRIVGLDGTEAVLRNVRRPDGFVAWDASRLCEDFLIVEAPSPRELR